MKTLTTALSLLVPAVFGSTALADPGMIKTGLWELSTDMSAPIYLSSSTKRCVTSEEIDKGFLPGNDKSCHAEDIQRAASSFSAQIVCDGRVKGKGTYRFSADSPEQFHAALDATFTESPLMARGGPNEMHLKVSGRWLGGDCASASPPTTPAAPK